MNTQQLQAGFWSGIMATGPMTAVLFRIHQELSQSSKKALPPAMLTSDLFDRMGISDKLSSNQRENLTILLHLVYGAFCGMTYSALTSQIKSNPITKGTLFGLTVWAASYVGWMPPMNLRTAATKLSNSRNTMMVLAHLVWGASLGYFENEMRLRQKQMLDGGDYEPRSKK